MDSPDMQNAVDTRTVPASSGPESAVRIRAASPLVLAAMTLGLSAADAIAMQAARAAETGRLVSMAALSL